MRVSTPEPLELQFTASIDAIPRARREAARWLNGALVARSIVDELTLVVTELVTNAIEASPGPLAHVCVEVRVVVLDGGRRVDILVTDEGDGFVFAESPAFPASNQVRGRGLPIVNALTDEFTVNRRWGRTEIRVSRLISDTDR